MNERFTIINLGTKKLIAVVDPSTCHGKHIERVRMTNSLVEAWAARVDIHVQSCYRITPPFIPVKSMSFCLSFGDQNGGFTF